MPGARARPPPCPRTPARRPRSRRRTAGCRAAAAKGWCAIACGVPRQPGDRVHEQVLVAEELDEEVVRELRVAVDDQPALRRARCPGRAQRPEHDLGADRHRPLLVAPGDESRGAGAHGRGVARRPALLAGAEERAADATTPSAGTGRTERVSENSGAASSGARIGWSPRLSGSCIVRYSPP